MRHLILIIASFMLSFSVTTPAVAEEFASDAAFVKWLQTYPDHPNLERIPDVIRYMARPGVLDMKKDQPVPWLGPFMIGFLSSIFREHPEKVDDWLGIADAQNNSQMSSVLQAVWFAKLPNSKAKVQAALETSPELRTSFEFAYRGEPKTIQDLSAIRVGMWVIEALWGQLMATGADNLAIIISVTTTASTETPPSVVATATLQYYARQSPNVLKLCEELLAIVSAPSSTIPKEQQKFYEEASRKQADILRKVIASAKESSK